MFDLIKDNFKKDKERIIFVIISVFVSYIFAHGFRMSNTMFSGDSLLMIHQNDYAWQISLGRCFQPIWLFIRGSISAPWMIICLSLLWLTLSVYFTADMLGIKKPISLIILSGIMTTSTALIYTNATFVPWSDFFALALFLAVLGVWLINKKKALPVIAGILCLTLSLGTYQAYISVALSIIIILLIKDLYQNEKISSIFKTTVLYVISFFASGIIYFIAWKIFQKAFHIWTSNSYNGLADIGDYSSSSLPSLILLSYKQVIYYFWNPDVFISLYFKGQSLSLVWTYILRAANTFILIFIIVSIIILHISKKNSAINIALSIILLGLFPIGINVICLISKGMVHGLMNYSYIMVYVLAIMLLEELNATNKRILLKTLRCIITVSLFAICWVNSVYANQVYLKKQLQEDAAKAVMSRIVNDIEKMEDYQPGNTKVSFIGSFAGSDELKSPDGFSDIQGYGISDTSLFYHGTEEAMILMELGVNMNIINIRDDESYTDDIESKIKDMTCYPTNGSIEYIGDIIVIKLSD